MFPRCPFVDSWLRVMCTSDIAWRALCSDIDSGRHLAIMVTKSVCPSDHMRHSGSYFKADGLFLYKWLNILVYHVTMATNTWNKRPEKLEIFQAASSVHPRTYTRYISPVYPDKPRLYVTPCSSPWHTIQNYYCFSLTCYAHISAHKTAASVAKCSQDVAKCGQVWSRCGQV